MKSPKFIFLFFILTFIPVYGEKGQILIPLRNITLSPSGIAQPYSGVNNIRDGKRDNDFEIFHTLWGGIPRQPVIIETELEGEDKRLDKVVLSPRGTGFNGIIKTAEVWVMERGLYNKIADLNADLSNAPLHLELDNPVKNPEKIKLIITDAYSDGRSGDVYMVSLGELQCVMLPEDAVTRAKLIEESKVFADLTGTKLNPKIHRKEIEELRIPIIRDLALLLYDKEYSPGLRLAEYDPYLSPDVLGERMRIGDGFSKYEGITGIVLDKGDNIIFVGETNGAKISLTVPEWTRKAPKGMKPEQDPAGWGLKSETFQLKEGPNLVCLEKGGHAYIQYFTNDDPENHLPIAVHFPTGKINGYFDITRGDTGRGGYC